MAILIGIKIDLIYTKKKVKSVSVQHILAQFY